MSCLLAEREPYWQISEATSSSILVDAGSFGLARSLAAAIPTARTQQSEGAGHAVAP
jgi:hypothetical protein